MKKILNSKIAVPIVVVVLLCLYGAVNSAFPKASSIEKVPEPASSSIAESISSASEPPSKAESSSQLSVITIEPPENSTASQDPGSPKKEDFFNISYVHDERQRTKTAEKLNYVYFDTNCFAMFSFEASSQNTITQSDANAYFSNVKGGFKNKFEKVMSGDIIEENIGNIHAYSLEIKALNGNGEVYTGDYDFKIIVFVWGGDIYSISYISPSDNYDIHYQEYEEIVSSVVFLDVQSQPNTLSESSATSVTESSLPTSTSVTTGQRNALQMAKRYLNYTAFSYKGLIGQLEYEKFSHEDAVYGADNCGADWNEQATKMAKQYLDYSSFSRAGLIDQLEYEGFTSEQAIFGVEANGY